VAEARVASLRRDDAAVGQALAALTDPTRRAVIALLARGPQRAGELASTLAMAPPSLSRHLRVLRRSGLIADDEPEHDARVRIYRLRPEALAPLQGWLEELQSFWSDQLHAFKAHAEKKPATPLPARRRRR
jgi:DNA-binding transcriptional ArsR family regulator